jgi:hypothetical protein
VKVFISWSGARSRRAAEALKRRLRGMLHVLEPYVSSVDMRSGADWWHELTEGLREAQFAIICLTPENMAGRWLHFEAGACWKALPEQQVCPLLFCGVGIENLEEPLKRFHARVFSEEGVRKLALDLNGKLGPQAIASSDLEESFKLYWPKLLKEAPTADTDLPEGEGEAPQLPDFDQEAVLLEILEAVRLRGEPAPYYTPGDGLGLQRAIALTVSSEGDKHADVNGTLLPGVRARAIEDMVERLASSVEQAGANLPLTRPWVFRGHFGVVSSHLPRHGPAEAN